MYKFGIIEGITIIGLFIEGIIGGGSTGVAMVVVSGVGVRVGGASSIRAAHKRSTLGKDKRSKCWHGANTES